MSAESISRLTCYHSTELIYTKQMRVVRFGRVPFGRVVLWIKSAISVIMAAVSCIFPMRTEYADG